MFFVDQITMRQITFSLIAFLTLIAMVGSCQKSDETTAGSNAAAATAPVPQAVIADWPAFHGGGPLLGAAAPITPPPMRVRWTYDANQQQPSPTTKPASGSDDSGARPSFEASAAIVDGVVFAANRAGELIAIDLASGKRIWIYKIEAGFSASPAVVNGVVFLGDEDGVFHAVDAKSGQKKWTFDTQTPIHSSANFVGDKIIFGDDGADIFCLNAADGKQAWVAKAGDRINGAPAIGAAPDGVRTAYVSGCDSQLRGINVADGKEEFAQDIGALCPGSPAIADGKVVAGTDGGKVVCYSSDGKKLLWSFEGVAEQAMVYGSPAVADGLAVVGARDRNVYALDLATGQKKWVFPTRGEVDSSPVISGGRVYVGSKDKRLYVLDLSTGKKLWDFVATRGIVATPAIAQGALVIGDTGGSLFCLEPLAK